MQRNPEVDVYFSDGCGRCALGGTPECKVHRWTSEMKLLRQIILKCGLTEERKWGVACYTYQKKNVIILGAFKAYCFISFFKGALLQDEHTLLHKAGENSQAGKLMRFTTVEQVLELTPYVKTYITEAISVEKSGAKVPVASELVLPEELTKMMEENETFRKAFNALTPGRQRGYVIYFSAAKQPKTRIARIEKAIPKILSGKGMHD
jgi:uncharacterized protein YdeI (YjbR/CyaY-like superfamily)